MTAATCSLFVAGCSTNLCTVTGRVLYLDGSPLAGGIVICEGTKEDGNSITCRGEIDKEGGFKIGTYSTNDGALPGKYRVQIIPPYITDSMRSTTPPYIDSKFESFDTSGLSIDIVQGADNVFELKVSKPEKWIKPPPVSD